MNTGSFSKYFPNRLEADENILVHSDGCVRDKGYWASAWCIAAWNPRGMYRPLLIGALTGDASVSVLESELIALEEATHHVQDLLS